MTALELSEQNRPIADKQSEQRHRHERANEKYHFSVTFIEDNGIHVQDRNGHEVAFEFPLQNVTFEEYDGFVQQMRNPNGPLPSIEDMVMAIHKPYSVPDHASGIGEPNSMTHPHTWEQHAKEHGLSVEEMKDMYLFAREQLYARFRSRLRPNA